MKRSRSRSGITLRDRDRQSSLTIHVCFLHETQLVRTNDANMEEAGILEKITRSGFCYPALNQVGFDDTAGTVTKLGFERIGTAHVRERESHQYLGSRCEYTRQSSFVGRSLT